MVRCKVTAYVQWMRIRIRQSTVTVAVITINGICTVLQNNYYPHPSVGLAPTKQKRTEPYCTKVTLGLYIEFRKVTEHSFIFPAKPRFGEASLYAHSSVQAFHENSARPL